MSQSESHSIRPRDRAAWVKAGAVLLTFLALGGGCDSRPTDPVAPQWETIRSEIYERATVEFSSANLFKPDSSSPHTNSLQFAPFIAQEIVSDGSSAASNEAPFKVYFRRETALIGDHTQDQLTYVWLRRAAAASEARLTGLRITLDSTGLPVIWECLGDSSGAEILIVSQSLEDIAHGTFGLPLAGRRHAIERGADAGPSVVVARVIENSPAPMGPIVHLRANGDVATVICRCMPPQFRRVVTEQEYELVPMGEIKGILPEGVPRPARLDQQLRLP
jgi:hypothetical protein